MKSFKFAILSNSRQRSTTPQSRSDLRKAAVEWEVRSMTVHNSLFAEKRFNVLNGLIRRGNDVFHQRIDVLRAHRFEHFAQLPSALVELGVMDDFLIGIAISGYQR